MAKAEQEKGPKKMSRREFLKETIAYALAFEGILIGAELSPFLGLLSEKAPGSVEPEDLKGLISVHDGIEIDVATDQKLKVYVDTDAFSYFLFNLFKFISPHDGPERLQAILQRKHLEIELNSGSYKEIVMKGKTYLQEAAYTSCMVGGPLITFPGDFLRYYRKIQVTPDIDIEGKLHADTVVAHEMTHLWRDIYSPISIPFSALYYNVLDTPDDQKYYEIEEDRISEAFIQQQYQSYVASPEHWHFGRVFRFV
jgi:hypothetical protein